MELTSPWPPEEVSEEHQNHRGNRSQPEEVGPQTEPGIPQKVNMLARRLIEATDTIKTQSIIEVSADTIETVKTPLVQENNLDQVETQEHHAFNGGSNQAYLVGSPPVVPLATIAPSPPSPPPATPPFTAPNVISLPSKPGTPLPERSSHAPATPFHMQKITRGTALLLIFTLLGIIFRATSVGPEQFLGTQGWAYVLAGSNGTNEHNLFTNIVSTGVTHTQAGATGTSALLTPQQYIASILHKMTLEQKLGQMMIVQFTGPAYSFELHTMVSQYGIGAVLLSAANSNIVDKDKLKGLIQQMQGNSAIPLAISTDQEGGAVDRLVALDGPRPSEASLGATNDPNQAMAAGARDAQDLASYGINLNLAPVVDVTTVYNPQLDTRTYGSTADLVTRMAEAYLKGLQQSGKVVGTLKHFPGLGDVGVDPHNGVPMLTRAQSDLENIDWAPYRALIKQGDVHAIMVTHEIVSALDSTRPSSLSPKVVKGILRDEMGFQGVIMTDSLTMEGITAYYTEAQAAALAIEAGSDLLMGASTPSDVASMIEGIKQAINAGDISQQTIDDSVSRILMMKYAMGLLSIPKQ